LYILLSCTIIKTRLKVNYFLIKKKGGVLMRVIKSKAFKVIFGVTLGLGLIGGSLVNADEALAGCHGDYSNGAGEIVPCA
jgi:hypothetical protein